MTTLEQKDSQPREWPFISVVIPAHNEEAFIEACLRSVLANDYPADRMEVLVIDGRSRDATRERVLAMARNDARLRLLDNPSKIVPISLNAGIRAARGNTILRMDAHATMAPDYIRRCVSLLATTGAENVGGRCLTISPNNSLQARTVAALTANPIIVGGSKFRSQVFEGWADTAVFGAWSRELFERIGYFHEQLQRNQDNEFNARIAHHGGRIWMSPTIQVTYFNQAKLSGLCRQAQNSGKWNAFTLKLAPHAFCLRHMAPGIVLAAWLLVLPALALGPTWPWAWLLVLPALGHIGGLTLAAFMILPKWGVAVAALSLPAAMVYHLRYGLGIWHGWWLVLTGRFRRHLPIPSKEKPLPEEWPGRSCTVETKDT